MRTGAAFAGVLSAFFLWQVPAHADSALAKEELKKGYALAQENKCEEAIPHLLTSLKHDPKGVTLINLASCEEKVGRLAAALGHWIDARTRAGGEGDKGIEEEAEKRAAALEPRMPRMTIILAPSVPRDAVVERDGIALGAPSLGISLPVDPGQHTVVLRVKDKPPQTTTFTIQEKEAKRIELGEAAAAAPAPSAPVDEQPPPEVSKGGGVNPLVFVGFGLAVVGIGVGSVTGVMALSAGSDAKTACPDLECNQKALDDVEKGRTMATISTAGFIVGGVGAVLGVAALLWKPKDAKTAQLLRGRF